MRSNNIYLSIGTLMVLMVAFLSSCKKVEHEIDDQIISINEGTVSVIQVGQKLRVGFLSNKVSAFEFSVVKDGTALLTESVTFESNEKIISREFDIPNDDFWVGEALLKVSYDAGGQRIEKTKAITFQESNPVMYVVGGSLGAGWEPTLSVPMSLYEEDSKTEFEIFEYITVDGDGFKFLPANRGWDDAYGKGATEGSLLQDDEAGNLTVEEDAFYRIRMDAENLTYELLKVSWGVIGDATPGGWDEDTDMSFAGGRGTYTWKATMNLVPGELKFRANDDWDINVGGTTSLLTPEGPNIVIDAAGTYNIELNLAPSGYTAEIVKQ